MLPEYIDKIVLGDYQNKVLQKKEAEREGKSTKKLFYQPKLRSLGSDLEKQKQVRKEIQAITRKHSGN